MPDSSLAPVDRNIAGTAIFIVPTGTDVVFQFPPRVTGESNSSIWPGQDAVSHQPVKIHMGSSGRSVNMEWEYIATDPSFSGVRIAEILRGLKAYFFKFEIEQYPLVKVKCGSSIPELTDFRLMNLQITHGQELVVSGEGFYPVHTKVAVTLELADTVSDESGVPKIDVDNLQSVNPRWY